MSIKLTDADWYNEDGNQVFKCCGANFPPDTYEDDVVEQILCETCCATWHDICLVRKYNYSLKKVYELNQSDDIWECPDCENKNNPRKKQRRMRCNTLKKDIICENDAGSSSHFDYDIDNDKPSEESEIEIILNTNINDDNTARKRKRNPSKSHKKKKKTNKKKDKKKTKKSKDENDKKKRRKDKKREKDIKRRFDAIKPSFGFEFDKSMLTESRMRYTNSERKQSKK